MIKVALLVIVTSSMNFIKMPNVSVTGFYEDIKSCHKVMDNIRESLNTEEIFDKNKIRYLKLEIREAHQEGFMYWTCQKKVEYSLKVFIIHLCFVNYTTNKQ